MSCAYDRELGRYTVCDERAACRCGPSQLDVDRREAENLARHRVVLEYLVYAGPDNKPEKGELYFTTWAAALAELNRRLDRDSADPQFFAISNRPINAQHGAVRPVANASAENGCGATGNSEVAR